MDGNRGSGCLGAALMAVLLVVVAVYLAVDTSQSQPGRAIVASDHMAYCRSEANTSPDKRAQLWFLRTHELAVGAGWIDVVVGKRGEAGILVRYHTAEKTSGGVSWRCKFGLAGAPTDKATGYFVRNGQPFEPSASESCLSTLPPIVNQGKTATTLQCDWVVPA